MVAALDPGLVLRLQERRERGTTRPELVTRPIYEKGRYISPTLRRLIALVARQSDLSTESIRGEGRVHRLVNARYCIANLAAEFAPPRLSAPACDDGMLRGQGMTLYYRMRHADRANLYPDYAALHERCRAELLAGGSP